MTYSLSNKPKVECFHKHDLASYFGSNFIILHYLKSVNYRDILNLSENYFHKMRLQNPNFILDNFAHS
jgi:hypothetical protein